MKEYANALKNAQEALRQEQFGPCVRECGAILEKALKDLLSDLTRSMEDFVERKRITEAEERIGEGKATFQRFGLGQLVGLYREAKVFDRLRRKRDSNLQKIRRINWDQVVEWRNRAAHSGGADQLDEDDAMQMLHWLKVFLYDCELLGREEEAGAKVDGGPAPPPPPECPVCKCKVEPDWTYCAKCGCALRTTCDQCDRPLAAGFKVCPYCEAPVQRKRQETTDQAVAAEEEYRIMCRGAYMDGVLTARERYVLNSKRLELGLTTKQAERIERECVPGNVMDYHHYVEGVFVDGIIDDYERDFLDKKAKELAVDPEMARIIEKEVDATTKARQERAAE